jgi:putative transcriptional regulator
VLFSEKLRAHRDAAGLTQSELSSRSGVPAGSIANIEQGIRSPSLETLVKLNTALGLSLGDWDGIEVEAKAKPAKAKPKARKK